VRAPAVTVLMSVYDGERHLRESVESILDQTLTDFELLVVDDASTDGSRAIVDSYGDPRVRVLTNEANVGLTRSLNRGLREAGGAYVARQDADDVSEPHRLERQRDLLDRRPGLALVASHYRRIDENGRHAGDRPVPTETRDIRWRLLFVNAFTHSSVTFRRDVVLELGGYDERFRYAQDFELWSRLARCHAVAAVPETLVSYRRSADSMTAAFERAGDEVREIVRRNLRELGVDAARIDVDGAWQVLFGSYGDVDAARAVAISGPVLDVQRAFARSLRLGPHVARRHRAAVCRTLGERLARLGLARRDPPALARGVALLSRAGALRLTTLPAHRRG
jgi:glycosyltransferase involved in cell wall biosynthesis